MTYPAHQNCDCMKKVSMPPQFHLAKRSVFEIVLLCIFTNQAKIEKQKIVSCLIEQGANIYIYIDTHTPNTSI